ncbi:hypothetical protein [Magnetofaba australis]|uniref:Putative membrane spanning protein n=1 Tax=Magnetofaba australis IT-1 TaxID=1434232 RepID=A0A1Y2K8U7_9PROT|nr:hypothetical protein [Magnetofaba australis]OSM06876.1 putative membrane spanning protein [Magnetofaba australis IT-1]
MNHALAAPISNRSLTLLALSMLVATLAIELFSNGFYLPNWDLAGNILGMERVYFGNAQYGKDILGPGLPLEFMAHYPSTVLAKWLGLDIMLANRLFVGMLQLLAWVTLLPFLLRLAAGRASGVWLLSIAYLLSFELLVGFDYGQRDHLFILLAFPAVGHWILREFDQPASPSTRILAFALAGFGCAVKPFYLLLPLVLLITAMIRQRSWRTLLRPEELTFTGVVAFCYVGFSLLHPDWYDQFFEMKDLYGALTSSPWWVITFSGQLYIFWAVLTALNEALLPAEDKPIFRILLLAALTCAVILVIQRRGWLYHWIPMASLMFFTFAAMALSWFRQPRNAVVWRRVIAVVAILALAWQHPAISRWRTATQLQFWLGNYALRVADATRPYLHPKDRVVYLTFSMPTAMTLSGMLGKPPNLQALPHLFEFAGVFNLLSRGDTERGEHYWDQVMGRWRHSIIDQRPEAILVDRKIKDHDLLSAKLDILEFFLRDEAIAKALRNYRQVDFPELKWSLLLLRDENEAAASLLLRKDDAVRAIPLDTDEPPQKE